MRCANICFDSVRLFMKQLRIYIVPGKLLAKQVHGIHLDCPSKVREQQHLFCLFSFKRVALFNSFLLSLALSLARSL